LKVCAGFFPFSTAIKKHFHRSEIDKGRTILLKLIAKADVLIENFGPEAVERLGVGYDTCRERNLA
jgi:hypothetical protein